ncbi:hypothetical protein QL285_095132 [Trifolium repens]|nr:hypothetical protein QL285_095132 [Trifolium repens]
MKKNGRQDEKKKKQTATKVKKRAKTKTQPPAPESKNETKKMTDETQSESIPNSFSIVFNHGVGASNRNFEHAAYESEELGSSDPDDSDEERGPRYERYRKEHMHQGYKWKFGLEFNSLQEFRDDVRDWSALKGLPVDWVKNESTRRLVWSAVGFVCLIFRFELLAFHLTVVSVPRDFSQVEL